MDKLKQKILSLDWDFDFLAVGTIDFNRQTFEGFELKQRQLSSEYHYFDLASMTKPLTLSLCYLKHPEVFDQNMLLLLNHQAGLPPYGELSRDTWKKQILQFPINKSPTQYSDYGALRLMLEVENKTEQKLSQIVGSDWDKEVVFWRDVEAPQVGRRVHDPNAYTIGEFCSHAGIFATLPGLCRTLLTIDERHQMISKVKAALQSNSERFVLGFDRAQGENSLAGPGCSPLTFGHLGFTGTSFWIDSQSMCGYVLLTNAIENPNYSREQLNRLRREIGGLLWFIS